MENKQAEVIQQVDATLAVADGEVVCQPMGKKGKKGYMSRRCERVAFSTYMVAQNMFYFTITTFLSAYLLMCGLTTTMTAIAILIVKVWDSVNDLIFGGMMDKIKFKNGGKFLPFLKMSLFFIPIATILMFSIPNAFTSMGKIVWFTIAYILWDTAYTVCDAPLHGLVTTMTNVSDERTYIMSLGRIMASIGAGFAVLVGTVLISEYVGLSYQVMAIVMGVLCLLLMLPIVFFGRERIEVHATADDSFGFKDIWNYLKSNKYLAIYYIGYVISQILNCGQSLGLFVSFYLFGNSMLTTLLGIMSVVPILAVGVLVPKILKRFDKMKVLITLSLICGAISLVKYFIGYDNFVIYAVLTVVSGLIFTPASFCTLMFTPDCVEYGKYKSGTDARGIAFSLQTFSVKIGASFASVIGIALLGLFGWQTIEASSFAELQALGVTQSASALNGLWFVTTLLPTIGSLLAVAVWTMYKLNDKDAAIMARCNNGEITREEAEQLLSRKY